MPVAGVSANNVVACWGETTPSFTWAVLLATTLPATEHNQHDPPTQTPDNNRECLLQSFWNQELELSLSIFYDHSRKISKCVENEMKHQDLIIMCLLHMKLHTL